MSNPYEELLQADQGTVPSKRRRIVTNDDKDSEHERPCCPITQAASIPADVDAPAECKEEAPRRPSADINVPETITTLRKHLLKEK